MRAGSPCRLTARRRTALLASLVLPAVVLRALVPVGFMLLSDGAGIRIGFCPGEAQPPGALAGAPAAGHLAHHHHDGGADHGSPAHAGHPPCLFALSASPAFVPATPALAPLPPPATTLAEFPSRASVPAIARAQFARGPPLPA